MNPLLLIGIILLVLWLLGFGIFKVAGLLIHILLIVAIVMLILWLLRRGGAKV